MEHGKYKLRQTNCDGLSEHTHTCMHTHTHTHAQMHACTHTHTLTHTHTHTRTHTHYLCIVLRTRVILKGKEGVVRHDNGPTVPQVHVKPWLCPQENTTALSVCVITTNAVIQVHVKILKHKLNYLKIRWTSPLNTIQSWPTNRFISA